MKHLLPIALLLSSLTLSATTVTYTADNSTNFTNPERGFYYEVEWKVTDSKTSNMPDQSNYFKKVKLKGGTLLLRLYYLNNFTDKDIPANALKAIENDMQLFRDNGCKMILRFAYTASTSKPYKDATPAQWKRHLEQLKPILQANEDVIACVQAGFLGVWGEWYYSAQGTGSAISKDIKKALIDELLDAVPASRAVQLRTPLFKTEYIGNTTPLTSAEAFNGSAKARLGHHNDAFLSGESNMGTYTNRTKDMNYIASDCLYLPNGGESNDEDNSFPTYTTGDKAKAELAQLHYSYLNAEYCPEVMNKWSTSVKDEIARKLGYRFVLTSGTYPASVAAGNKMAILLSIQNEGYASPYNKRTAYIVLKNGSKTYSLPLTSDPRRWTAGATTTINESLTVPTTVPTGSYDLYLYLPDASSKLASDPAFAIRMANNNTWDAATGMNKLNAQIQVTAGTTPDPEPQPVTTLDPVTDFSAVASSRNILLSWTNPQADPPTPPTPDTYEDLSSAQNVSYSGCSASASYNNSTKVSTISYSTSGDWLWAGVEYAASVSQNITSLSFEYKGNGTEVVIIPYLSDGTYAWTDEDNCPDLSSTDWQTFTLSTFNPLWDEPAYSFGTNPITHFGFRANPASAASGSFAIRNVKITTSSNKAPQAAPAFSFVKIMRQLNAMPSYTNGTMVYNGTQTSFTDADLSPGTYYYAAYAVYSDGTFAIPATAQVTISSTDIQSPNHNTKVKKVMHNGQIFILNLNTRFNLLGQPTNQ